MKGHLWHLRYPLEGKTFDPEDRSTYIVVATTRPETMLGDVAVAVHPDDERYRDLVKNKVHAILPLVGRRIPIVADEYSDPEKGTGAVKITPAHDFNDFDVGKRHDLPQINVLDLEAKLALKGNDAFLNGVKPSSELDETLSFDKLDRFAARKKIVERLEANGLLDKIEPHTNMVPHGDRSGAVIEPYLTDQWYVDAKSAGEAGDRGCAFRQNRFRAEELGKDLLRVDGEYPAMVRVAAAVVGSSDPGMVWALKNGRLALGSKLATAGDAGHTVAQEGGRRIL